MQLPANVQLLTRWATRQREGGVRVSEVHRTPDNPDAAAYVDLDSDAALARATVWPELHADLVVLDVASGAELENAHVTRVRPADLDRLVSAIQRALVRNQTAETCSQTRIATARIVSSYVRRGNVRPDDLVLAIGLVGQALISSVKADDARQTSEAPVRRRRARTALRPRKLKAA